MNVRGRCFFGIVIAVGLVLTAGGCVSLSKSPIPRFYALHTAHVEHAAPVVSSAFSEIVGVGPVKIPEYMQRPQIVTQDSGGMMQFAEFDRWGESPDAGIARLIGDELSRRLPAATCVLYPWNSALAVKYRVTLDVVGLACDLTGTMHLVTQWSIVDQHELTTLVMKRRELDEPLGSPDYQGYVSALSAASTTLGSEIAAAFETLEATSRAD